MGRKLMIFSIAFLSYYTFGMIVLFSLSWFGDYTMPDLAKSDFWLDALKWPYIIFQPLIKIYNAYPG